MRYTYPTWGPTRTMTGTIASNGTTSGTWSDDYLDETGTWTSTVGQAQFLGGGKGALHYSDVTGAWYDVNVKYVTVSGDEAWFAGPVVAASNSGWIGNWLFAKVYDGGEPAAGVDQVWGSFTNETAAKDGVAAQSNPTDGPFTVEGETCRFTSHQPGKPDPRKPEERLLRVLFSLTEPAPDNWPPRSSPREASEPPSPPSGRATIGDSTYIAVRGFRQTGFRGFY
jgi:hypothetical protein